MQLRIKTLTSNNYMAKARHWLYLWPIMFVIFMATMPNAMAIEPAEQLADKQLEQRAREISSALRCMVCQNQTIDDSNADIAKTLRVVVRERLVAGDNNDQVIQYIVGKYGHFVLMKPPFYTGTYILWFSPLILAVFGIWLLWRYYRRPRLDDNLTDDELQRAQQKLKEIA